MFDRIRNLFSIDMGIDLGTCNTLVCVRGEGIVLNEPSVVAVRKGTNKVMVHNGQPAIGFAAKEMLGKAPGSISAIRPLKDGVISDFEITETMLAYFIKKVVGKRTFVSPRVVIAVPGGITQVEKAAVFDAAHRAGAGQVYLVEEPMAAALGADLPVTEATASMIVDIGGGTTDIAVTSLADIAHSETVRVAGDAFDKAIVEHMKNNYKLLIGEQTAEKIKVEIGSASPDGEDRSMEVRGRDIINGLPRKIMVTGEEIRQCLQEPLMAIVSAILRTLERCDPELSSDLLENGIVLAGGGGMLRGLPTMISNATGLACRVADEPLTCVARGTAHFLEHLEELKDAMETDNKR